MIRGFVSWARDVLVGTPWQPAAILRIDVVRLTWLMAALALIRGLDYGTGRDMQVSIPEPLPGQPAPPSPLIGIESAAPLYVWAAGLLLSCVALTVGMRLQRHGLVWVSHVVLSIIYFGLAVGLLSGYLERPYFDGIRNATVLLLPAALHALLWWRMGPTPVVLTTEGPEERERG